MMKCVTCGAWSIPCSPNPTDVSFSKIEEAGICSVVISSLGIEPLHDIISIGIVTLLNIETMLGIKMTLGTSLVCSFAFIAITSVGVATSIGRVTSLDVISGTVATSIDAISGTIVTSLNIKIALAIEMADGIERTLETSLALFIHSWPNA
jgi:hypothetical protein